MCSVPIAFTIFNRPDLTARVFERIRNAQPKELFVIADGPRTAAEKELCRRTRDIVQVDWDCKVRFNFSESNLGCGYRPATGLDWVFSQVEEAIILEDDCLPTPSFFDFCENLLEHYRDDHRVMHISGDVLRLGPRRSNYSYYFSKYTHGCGWATWRRAWKYYDFAIRDWADFKAQGMLKKVFRDPVERAFWKKKMEPFYEQARQDAWDFQWNFALWMQGGLSIFPTVNLISNLGWRADATHTQRPSKWGNLPTGEMGDISHPATIAVQEEIDAEIFDDWFGGSRLRERRTLLYQLAKPARVWRKLRGETVRV